MSSMRAQIGEMAHRLFGERVSRAVLDAAAAGQWPRELWDAVVESGLVSSIVPEDQGGIGLEWRDVYPAIRAAGRHCAPIPLAETIIASSLLGRAGIPIPKGILSLQAEDAADHLVLSRDGAGWRLSGLACGIPWGRIADYVILSARYNEEHYRIVASTAGVQVASGHNIADEPRDRLTFDGVPVEAAPVIRNSSADCARTLGALARTAQLSGAFEAILLETVNYVNERKQFGRPLAKFQAVQQNLAVMAEEVAATRVISEAAFIATDRGDSTIHVASAKVRSFVAAQAVTSIAHQLFGAIGFTREHHLHHMTQRAWAWRGEFGGEREWASALGRQVLEAGGDGVWSLLTDH
jgi:acyl-CoA dehydrogenase